MKAAACHLLLCDFDRGLAVVTDEVSDAAPWQLKFDRLREGGRNITCHVLPADEPASHRDVAERFCHKHGLKLSDEPFR